MRESGRKIWLVNHYAMPPEYESRLRTIKFANYLTELGYNVTVFSSSFLHNTEINLISDKSQYLKENYGRLKFIHIKTRSYKRSNIWRFYNLFEFHFKLFLFQNKFDKPEIIVHTVLPPFGNIIYWVAKRLKAKYIIEVLDLWPESFVDMGLLRKSNPFLKFLYFAEKWIYKNADNVIFSMEGGRRYIIDKKWDTKNGGPIDLNKVYYINNGVDLSDYSNFLKNFQLSDPDLNNNNTIKVIYIGSIRLANNLLELIEAANYLRNKDNIKFLLYGDGDDRQYLINYCSKNGIDNVVFKDKWISPEFVPFILSKSELNILNYKSGSFGKYGGSQSKLFQYMASGKPICSNIKMMYCPITKYNLGIAKEYSSAEEYANAILKLLSFNEEEKSELKKRMSKIVRKFDYKILTNELVSLF